MLYVSIIVELLRARPALTVWIAVCAQAAIWTLVPGWFYAGPPGNVPMVLAIGHEFQAGSYLGPPLAFEAGLILLTTSAGALLIGLMVLFTVANTRTRAALRAPLLWPAGLVAAAMLVPHAFFIAKAADDFLPMLVALRAPEAVSGNFGAWL